MSSLVENATPLIAKSGLSTSFAVIIKFHVDLLQVQWRNVVCHDQVNDLATSTTGFREHFYQDEAYVELLSPKATH